MKWTATESDVKGLWNVKDEAGNSIAQYLDKASAETIAAAPDILELLKRAVNWLDDTAEDAQRNAQEFTELLDEILRRINP